MIICGIKVTHDGGVALIDGSRLLFSIEAEKLNNSYRYSTLEYLEQVGEILRAENIDPGDIDEFVIDGWWSGEKADSSSIESQVRGKSVSLRVAPYLEERTTHPCMTRYSFTAQDFGFREIPYSSYHHATGHLFSCYCSSPFARRGEDALVLVWDGGMTPQLFEVRFADLSARRIGPLLPVTGNMFGDFAGFFEPFHAEMTGWDSERSLRYHLGIAGKAMAFAALGRVSNFMLAYFEDFIDNLTQISVDNADLLAKQVILERPNFSDLSNADIISSLQSYLGDSLLASLRSLVQRRFRGDAPNLGVAGGCALNIKWNKQIRDSGLCREVWIPPFPNDSGAAIGAAAAEMFVHSRQAVLDWDVYKGPRLLSGDTPSGWERRSCDEEGVARILHHSGQPVIVLSGRAELGPRALGNRSILASATDLQTKGKLNALKSREDYRPIAPICLEERASEIFDPGTPDRYMLFEHRVRPEWITAIPAIAHIDGTARLQTTTRDSGPAGRILSEYERLSGIPVLCNTSANFSGRGFFPDVESAARWGKVNYIWADGVLFSKNGTELRR
jgi:carbamoyltransferase